ncbi:diphthamide synthase domain-containing protein [Hirsutella rhossiliensis]|uniref:Diphthine--ammonia ligase n=1 Tax=Hirsutella rhossiliensis TaxID=111463 RepID=A0A9P8MXR6_9HYPO|nr:diphthamide synthase domain-containing protein [Hirsutella rhossiliensis]KAH0963129.1 diphthamide synthase domain-containing protein [Hirsutella rhossiliensis]
MAPEQRLRVIALVSGGKDSFYSLLHCMRLGHGVVALANLYPTTGDEDLNSFMYQTVGHEVVPLYATATGIPLYRQPILGRAACHARDYQHPGRQHEADDDETESMVPLLRAVMARHPEANALCSGAILSTYQRTRVESVALRLGLVPLAYLWKYPVLPPPADDVQLLRDMAAAGLEARIVKVASAGLDESRLWEPVTTPAGALAVQRAVQRFGGAAQGAALGEGGEFETIVLDGPPELFKMRIAVPDDGRTIVAEGGGASWMMLRGAYLEEKLVQPPHRELPVRTPALLDAGFEVVLRAIPCDRRVVPEPSGAAKSFLLGSSVPPLQGGRGFLQWSIMADASFAGGSIEEETIHVVDKIRSALSSVARNPAQITSTIIVLADMSDFSKVNDEYKKLFTEPNPPSRVTISCGRLLPAGRRIVIHVAMPDAVLGRGERNGLHVQARSFWAPANIGPYSQAIDVPAATGLRAVYVAGQIPLVPASMRLPPAGERALHEQLVLSLQHLWRIGVEMKVQCWTSAVAYFAKSSSADAMVHQVKLASEAWSLLHVPPEDDDDDDDDDSGPDLWDLKYNHAYKSRGYGDTQSANTALPDCTIFTLRQQKEPETCVPPMFAVEVESLPRESDVEWHAHMGLGHIDTACAEMMCLPGDGDSRGWGSWHTIVRSGDAILVHTVVACGLAESDPRNLEEQTLASVYRASLRGVGLDAKLSCPDDAPYLAYVDAACLPGGLWQDTGTRKGNELTFEPIPCHSIWSPQAERLGCVALYRATMVASP